MINGNCSKIIKPGLSAAPFLYSFSCNNLKTSYRSTILACRLIIYIYHKKLRKIGQNYMVIEWTYLQAE